MPQTTEDGQRITLGQIMAQVKQIRDAQAVKTRLSEFDQGLGSVTHQVRHPNAKRREALVDASVPGIIRAIYGHLFHQQVATGKVHEHQHQTLQEGFIHGPDDRSYLAMGNALLFPGCGGVEDDALQRMHHTAQGARRTPHMRLKMEMAEKLAERFGPHAALEAKHKQGGHDQANEPVSACLRFPKR